MRRLALAIPLAVVMTAACGSVAPSALTPGSPSPLPSASAVGLPTPVVQPITRVSAGAQVAWVRVRTANGTALVSVGPTGSIGKVIETSLLGIDRVARSADGSELFLFAQDRIDVYSAFTGERTKTYPVAGARVNDSAFSRDGRWVALLLPASVLHFLDLATGLSQTFTLAHDPNAKLPGLSGNTSGALWETLAFANDSARLYVVNDWGGPARLTAFALTGTTWAQTATSVDGQAGVSHPSCAGPALRMKVVLSDRALASFCHVDGAVWIFDLGSFASAAVLRPRQDNPFWLSPIFTPDGQLLYLHQSPAFGDQMQVVDLAARRVVGPVRTPTRVGDRGPFALVRSIAYAGGTASTMPISPDGLRLYSAMGDGIVVLRVPDLEPVAKLASGHGTDEVWIAGNGKTVYATSGKNLIVVADSGSGLFVVDLPGGSEGFVSSERG